MSKIVKELLITNINTLIDINDKLNNFDFNFKIINLDDSNGSFELAIVSQTDLEEENFKYRKVVGKTRGNINSKDNVYENYVMLLKSNTDCKCRIELYLTELPYNKEEEKKKEKEEKKKKSNKRKKRKKRKQKNQRPKRKTKKIIVNLKKKKVFLL